MTSLIRIEEQINYVHSTSSTSSGGGGAKCVPGTGCKPKVSRLCVMDFLVKVMVHIIPAVPQSRQLRIGSEKAPARIESVAG